MYVLFVQPAYIPDFYYRKLFPESEVSRADTNSPDAVKRRVLIFQTSFTHPSETFFLRTFVSFESPNVRFPSLKRITSVAFHSRKRRASFVKRVISHRPIIPRYSSVTIRHLDHEITGQFAIAARSSDQQFNDYNDDVAHRIVASTTKPVLVCPNVPSARMCTCVISLFLFYNYNHY